MAKTIYTIGYEGAVIDAFVTKLSDAGIARVVDVRAVPLSRKKGFSKNKLAGALQTENIAYSHFRALGTPREGRTAVKNGDIDTMHRIFGTQLQTPEAQQALHDVAALAKREKTCLLCFEADPKTCHRTIVAHALRDGDGFTIQELYMDKALFN